MSQVVIVDYGLGNIKSVQRALEFVGANVTLSSEPSELASADRLLLPGVGAFARGVSGLESLGLLSAVSEFVATGKPVLGICLGMQLLLDRSEEGGNQIGCGYIPGSVIKIPQRDGGEDFIRKTPHIGWSALQIASGLESWEGSLLQSTVNGEFFYFVHSFMAVPDNKADILAVCEYNSLDVVAAVRKDNITGLQFHPEKSGKFGLKILKEFIS